MSEAQTTTAHRAANLTSASALAMYDAAANTCDKLRAAAAMADVLRSERAMDLKADPKPRKAATAPSDILTAESLGATLKRICGVVERRNTIPVLGCVLLESDGGTLRLSATDLDMLYVEALRSPNVELPKFAMAVNAYDLAASLRGAKGDVVLVDASSYPAKGAVVQERQPNRADPTGPYITVDVPAKAVYALKLIAGGSEVKFPALPPGDFPVMNTPHHHDGKPYKPATATFPAAVMLEPLAFIAPAISGEETRYYLNGAYIHTVAIDGLPRLTFAATDGSCLRVDTQYGADRSPFDLDQPPVILPRKAAEWLLRFPPTGEITMDIWEQQVRIKTTIGTFQTKVIDGSFPDYRRVIPAGPATTVVGISETKDFAARVLKLGAQTREKQASICLVIERGKVNASARNLEGGTARAELPAEPMGRDSMLSFNSKYLAGLVTVGGVVTIDLGSPNDPAKFLWADKPGRIGVCMPLRV